MKNILDKIAELPSGLDVSLWARNWNTRLKPEFNTDDLKALASHLKRMEEMLENADALRGVMPNNRDTFQLDKNMRGHWQGVNNGEGGHNFIHPDALTAFESLKENT